MTDPDVTHDHTDTRATQIGDIPSLGLITHLRAKSQEVSKGTWTSSRISPILHTFTICG